VAHDAAKKITVDTTDHTLTEVALPPVQARVVTTVNLNLGAVNGTIDGVELVGTASPAPTSCS
jgi:hypothetical protein